MPAIPMITDAVISEGWLTMEELVIFAVAESTLVRCYAATLVGFTFINESPIVVR